jgi:hypothetical protein
MEDSCVFVSSRGILKSTDIHVETPVTGSLVADPTLYAQIKRGSIVYVCNTAILDFIENVLPTIKDRFVLVSGDSDTNMPFQIISYQKFNTFIEDPRLGHWFCQNLLISHPKITHIPIGLDYHTIAKEGSQHPWGLGSKPLDQEQQLIRCNNQESRKPLCYVNFHHTTFGIIDRGDRKQLLSEVPHHLIYFEPTFINRKQTWENMSSYSFVLSPRGGGFDCHRTWEALCLGCIPIVKSSGLDPLYKGLPVIIVKEWSDVTPDLLASQKFDRLNLDKLKLSYWLDLFKKQSELC